MVSRTHAIKIGVAAAVSVSSLVACNLILGIDSATVDPTLLDSSVKDANVGDTADATNPYSCEAYCNQMANNCSGNNQEYTSYDVCLVMCAKLEPGRPGETVNNSLACRISHATAAATDPNTHCQQAGPLGYGTCTTNPCTSFCSLTYTLCDPLKLFPYDGGEPGCRAACTGFTYYSNVPVDAGEAGVPDAGGAVGDLVFAAGDNLNCRIYHLESAYEVGNTQAPSTHCPHTAVSSATCN